MKLDPTILYSLTGCGLFVLSVYAAMAHTDLLRKILAINVAGSGVFLVFVAFAHAGPDPVPQAMVLTGIVVAVCGTAVAAVLAGRVHAATGKLDIDGEDPGDVRQSLPGDVGQSLPGDVGQSLPGDVRQSLPRGEGGE